jgi:hypothetical protein
LSYAYAPVGSTLLAENPTTPGVITAFVASMSVVVVDPRRVQLGESFRSRDPKSVTGLVPVARSVKRYVLFATIGVLS